MFLSFILSFFYALSFVQAATKESAKEKCLVISILKNPSKDYIPSSLYWLLKNKIRFNLQQEVAEPVEARTQHMTPYLLYGYRCLIVALGIILLYLNYSNICFYSRMVVQHLSIWFFDTVHIQGSLCKVLLLKLTGRLLKQGLLAY